MDREYVRKIEGLLRQKCLSFDKILQQPLGKAQNRLQQILLTGSLVGDELAMHLSQSHMCIMPFSQIEISGNIFSINIQPTGESYNAIHDNNFSVIPKIGVAVDYGFPHGPENFDFNPRGFQLIDITG